jgi:nitrogenase molybdenum-iron protein beta chain
MNDTTQKTRSLQIDALNMCPPIGAMYAACGVHGCLPHSHGASGCCRFQRMEIAKHFQKIIRVTSSMLYESAAVFGGKDNLRAAVKNAFQAYNPEVIAVHTTCLSETIGDDLNGIAAAFEVPEGKHVVWATTPGYAGSQLTGYSTMTDAMLRQLALLPGQLALPSDTHRLRIFLIPGLLNPADVDEISRYAGMFFDAQTVFPDVRGIFDSKTPRNEREYLPGGTPVEAIINAAACSDAIAFGAEAAFAAADTLHALGVSTSKLPLPIGLEATDRLIGDLSRRSGRPAPAALKAERARTVDVVMNLHPRLYGKKAALFCDADLAVSLTAFLCEIGMQPVYVCTGYAEEAFENEIKSLFERYHIDGVVNRQADRYDLEQYLEKNKVDLLLGGTRGKILARKFDIPLVRVGFPVIDRPLEYLTPVTGYRGCLHLMQKLLAALQEHGECNTRAQDLVFAESF